MNCRWSTKKEDDTSVYTEPGKPSTAASEGHEMTQCLAYDHGKEEFDVPQAQESGIYQEICEDTLQ